MKKGFSLIESLIYLSCVVLIISALIIVLNSFYLNTKFFNTRINKYIEFVIGFDHLLNDLKQTESTFKSWKVVTNNEIIYEKDNQDISWLLLSNKLYKFSGNFNLKNKTWSKRSMSLVIQSIDKLEFIMHRDKLNNIFGISTVISSEGKKNKFNMQSFIAVRLGVTI